MLKAFFLIILITAVFSGCAGKAPPDVKRPLPSLEHKNEVDPETRQRVEHILRRVKRASESRSLENLGRTTMNEAVVLMDLGNDISSIIIKALKQNGNWKYRFWLVDILGFVGGTGNIIPLVEVIEDTSEHLEVRLRACESLKELRLPSAIPHLLIARELVNESAVKEAIQKAIDFLR